METRNDCEIACDCVKRANVVLHVDLCKEIFARKHTATHKPTSAQPTHCATMTHTHTSSASSHQCTDHNTNKDHTLSSKSFPLETRLKLKLLVHTFDAYTTRQALSFVRSTKFDHPLTAHNAPPEHKHTPHLLFHELANQLAQKAQHFLAPYCGMSFLAISALFLLYIHFGKSLWFTWIPCNEASACRVSIIKQTNKHTHTHTPTSGAHAWSPAGLLFAKSSSLHTVHCMRLGGSQNKCALRDWCICGSFKLAAAAGCVLPDRFFCVAMLCLGTVS